MVKGSSEGFQRAIAKPFGRARRRGISMTQDREEITMAEGSKNVQQSLTIIRGLEDAVQSAGKSWMRADMCLLNRRQMQDDLALLRECLPTALESAEGIVKNEESILKAAQDQGQAAISEARQEAERIQAEAKAELEKLQEQIKQAEAQVAKIQKEGEQLRQQLTAQAQQQAQQIVDAAQRQGQQIVAEGEQQARALAEKENVYLRAKVAADELTEKNEAQLAQLRQKTFAYLDDVLGQAEQYVGGLIQDVHQERENMKSYR